MYLNPNLKLYYLLDRGIISNHMENRNVYMYSVGNCHLILQKLSLDLFFYSQQMKFGKYESLAPQNN